MNEKLIKNEIEIEKIKIKYKKGYYIHYSKFDK